MSWPPGVEEGDNPAPQAARILPGPPTRAAPAQELTWAWEWDPFGRKRRGSGSPNVRTMVAVAVAVGRWAGGRKGQTSTCQGDTQLCSSTPQSRCVISTLHVSCCVRFTATPQCTVEVIVDVPVPQIPLS